MGQAAVDLPDPKQTPPAGPSSDADDLLSQMAGDEIDRMLSEAETPRGTQSADALQAELDGLLTNISGEAGQPSISNDSAMVGGDTPADAVIPSVDAPSVLAPVENSPIVEKATAVEDVIPVDSPVVSPVESSIPAAVPTDTLTEVVPVPVVKPEETVGAVLDAAMASNIQKPAPLVIRLLEWLNSPFALLPDDVLTILGKVAIITLMNALAVLAYVLLFRKH